MKKLLFTTLISLMISVSTSIATDHIKLEFHRITPEGKDKWVYESVFSTEYYWTEYRDGYDEKNYHKSTPYTKKDGKYELCDFCADDHMNNWCFEQVWKDYFALGPYMYSRWKIVCDAPVWIKTDNDKFRTSIKFGTKAHFQAYTDFQEWDYDLTEVTVN